MFCVIRCGMGHLELPNGATYDGQFMKGLPNGVGVMRFTDSSRYEGKLTQNMDLRYWCSNSICFEAANILCRSLRTVKIQTQQFKKEKKIKLRHLINEK